MRGIVWEGEVRAAAMDEKGGGEEGVRILVITAQRIGREYTRERIGE
jgi:hypothetical protein